MLISDLTAVPQLPQPSLGLLNAIHTTTARNISEILANDGTLPAAHTVSNQVFLNDTGDSVTLPASGNWPTRILNDGEYVGVNSTLYYKVINKPTNTFQIVSVANGVFTTALASPSIANGQTAKFCGFKNPSGFANNETHTIQNLSGNTFKIVGAPSASADIAGWIHTNHTNSYYPAAFDRTAFSVSISASGLPIGDTFTLSRVFTARTIAAATAASWCVVFEFGVRKDKATPAPIGPNIEEYDFLPPALEQQLILTDLTTTNALGITFTKTGKDGDDFMTGSRLIYSRALNLIPGTYPTTNDFILRIRMCQFDIQDNVTDLSGYVAYTISPPTA